MFSNNKNQNDNSGSGGQNSQTDLSKVPFHTMQDDLNSLNNPNMAKEEFINVAVPDQNEKKLTNENYGEQKPESPFLNISSSNPSVAKSQPFQPQSFQSHPVQSQPVRAQFVQSPIPPQYSAPIAANPVKSVQEEKEDFLKSLAEKRDMEKEEKQKNADAESAPKNGAKKIIFIGIGSVVILAFLAGGYYFWMIRKNNSSPSLNQTRTNSAAENTAENASQENNDNSSAEVPDNNQTNQAPIQSQFSNTNPNILSISVDNPGAQDINQLLVKTASNIESQQITAPLEFIVTDKNNNPVSFVDFTAQAGIKLPASILGLFDKDFSIYFYEDNGNMRLGLSVSLKDAVSAKGLFQQEEKNLYSDFSPLYIEAVPSSPIKTVFATSTYNDYSIRYMNVDAGLTTSVDYTIGKSQFILGTSKQTMRAILDKISHQAASGQ